MELSCNGLSCVISSDWFALSNYIGDFCERKVLNRGDLRGKALMLIVISIKNIIVIWEFGSSKI
jgi:hypothetical protein